MLARRDRMNWQIAVCQGVASAVKELGVDRDVEATAGGAVAIYKGWPVKGVLIR